MCSIPMRSKCHPLTSATTSLRAGRSPADIIIVDSPEPGSGVPFDWSLLGGIARPERMMLAGGLNLDNVADAVAQLRPADVVLDPAHARALRLSRDARHRLQTGDVEVETPDLSRYYAFAGATP